MDQLYKEIVNFQRRCNDYIDNPSDSAAQSLRQEVQRLEDDAQVKKNPRSIEDRVKQVIRQLESIKETQAMSPAHANELIDHCEHFRHQLQKLS